MNNLLEEIKSRMEVSDIGCGVYMVCCPFHGEKTASVFFDIRRDEYLCFSCRAQGTSKDFIAEFDKTAGSNK